VDHDQIACGTAALAVGDWRVAQREFEDVLQQEESAIALEGLAEALFWLEQYEQSIDRRTRAYTLYRKTGNLRSAARAALWLAISQASALGNVAVAQGWMQRAKRLLDTAGPCAELGWFEHLCAKMSSNAEDTAAHAREAVEIARRHDDVDLEIWALSEQGRALVAIGQVDEGMAMLDEATAAATGGEVRSLFVVGNTCCNMLSACDRAADFQRAVQWCQVVDDFTRRHHCPPIFHYCRVIYSGVLIASGRWDDAERELKSALEAVGRGYPGERAHSLSRLALLCVRRGRLEEAEQLLAGIETQGVAAEAAARLQIARGQPAVACALIERRIETTGDGLGAVPLLVLLVEAMVPANLDGARDAAHRLDAIAQRARRPPFDAMALLCRARVNHASGDACPAEFERASEHFQQLGMPFDAAVARLECAAALAEIDGALAAEDARNALSAFERLGARPYADKAAALVRELGGGSSPRSRTGETLTRREQEVLALLSHGLSNSDIGTRLFISTKTVEHHVGRILSKLGLRSRLEAVAWTLRSSATESGHK
jgi:ATP/maltotriose-dependent transcriptional regulator MalT